MKPRHIGILTHTAEFGGMETQTVGLGTVLAARGHRVVLLELGDGTYAASGRVGPDSGITVRSIPSAPSVDRLRAKHWRRILRAEGFDGVVLTKGWIWAFWPALDWAVRTGQIPYVTVEHSEPPIPEAPTSRRHLGGVLPGLGLWRLPGLLRWGLHRRAVDRFVTVSAGGARILTEHYGVPTGKMVTVPNGIDPSRFCPDPGARAVARNRWQVTEREFVFGYVGRLAREKRIDRLLESFAALEPDPDRGEHRLVIIGRGPEEAVLRARSAELGLASRCVWVGETAAPWREYPGLDATLLTSEHEGLPLALLEAMASGCVAIAMEAGGVAEVLEDGITGRLVRQDVGEFTVAMQSVASATPEWRAGIGARAREHVVRHHDARVQLPLLASTIEETLCGSESA